MMGDNGGVVTRRWQWMERPIEVEQKILSDDQFMPSLLRVGNFTEHRAMKGNAYIEKRHLLDYEIEFYTYSKGGMQLDSEYFEVKKNDICIKRPGQYTRARMPYTCYVIGIDPSGSGHKVKFHSPYTKGDGMIPLYQHRILDSLPSLIRPENPAFYKEVFESIMMEYLNPSDMAAIVLRQLITHLLIALKQEVTGKHLRIQSAYKKPIDVSMDYMNDHIADKVNLNDLAQLVGMSASYFHQIFKKEMGLTPLAYLQKMRLDLARKLLVMSNISMAEIAIECGFESTTYFATFFKKKVGLTPSAYRLQHNRYQV